MYRKFCKTCQKYSYSSDPYGTWICPYCNHNLTNVLPVIPNAKRSLKKALISTDQSIFVYNRKNQSS